MFLFYAIICYFLWSYIHEYCHLYALKQIRNVKSYKFRLYPHNHKELGFVFASVSYDYDKDLNAKENAYVAFAPRVANYIAVFSFVFACMFVNKIPDLYAVFTVGCSVDLLRGSYSRNETADIERYCSGWDLNKRMVIFIQALVACINVLLLYIYY